MSCNVMKLQLSQHLSRDKNILSCDMSFMSYESDIMTFHDLQCGSDFYRCRSCNICIFSLTKFFASVGWYVIKHSQTKAMFTQNTRLRLVFSIHNLTRLVSTFVWFQNNIDQAVS